MTASNLSRRHFLKASAITGGSLVIGLRLGITGSHAQTDGNLAPNAFLEITPENTIIFHCPRDEMGQGVDTGLGTIIGEELHVPPSALDIRRPGANKAFNNPEFPLQITGGSNSLKSHYLPLRQTAANTRELVLQAASSQLGLPREQLSTENAQVITTRGDRYPYGDFVATAANMPLPENAPLTAEQNFKYIGKDSPRLDGLAKSTGTAVFGIDVDFPGLYRAVLVRCPVAGGSVKSFSAEAARSVDGVSDIVQISNGVAVVAPHFWQARQGAAVLEIEWNLPPLASVDTAGVKADFKEALALGEGVKTAQDGELEEGFGSAEFELVSEYWTPYLAHAPLEPMNAIVKFENGKADVWSGTQSPSTDQALAARALDIGKGDVTVHSTYMGGGFGRRGTLTHVTEAAEIARETGKPVQLLWTREDDLRNGVFRPASLMRIRAGVDSDGQITGWQATRVGGNMMPTSMTNSMPAMVPGFVPQAMMNMLVSLSRKAYKDWTVDHSSIEGLYEDYDLPNREVEHITVDHGLPLTFWRSVGHSYTAFAKETMIDELAHRAGIPPVELRLRNTRENPRLANVIRVAGELMDKTNTPHSLGMAAHSCFASYVAQVAEVSVQGDNIKVHKVTCVVDCGLAVNPDVVRAQMEGGVMFALTAALHGNLELKNGAIVESNFHDYPILRMNEAPEVEVVIIDSKEPPTGVGEPGVPPVAPAVANAVFAATGQRLKTLPLTLV
jgi:isoquinoline 1-oxidoreductase subunit beta